MDASVSDGSAVSRGPDADVGMFSDAIGVCDRIKVFTVGTCS